MSHLVSYKWFRRTQFITSIGLFYKNGDFTWRVSDCEELVVVITRDGVNVISGTKEKECNVMDTYIDT